LRIGYFAVFTRKSQVVVHMEKLDIIENGSGVLVLEPPDHKPEPPKPPVRKRRWGM
jgi:hypothetical protein